MDSLFWAQLHGATTHFPVACILCSGASDAAGFALSQRPVGRDLHVVGYWTMLAAAAGSVPAVASGIMMTRGSILGHGALRSHHLFVWPSFALLVALAVWRVLAGARANRRAIASYLALVAVTTCLVSAAGYWGGELMLSA